MTEERNVTANFTVNFYDLNLFATSGGSVSGTGRFEHGTSRTVSATALPGYSFTGWSGEGITNGFSTATTVMMTQDRNLTASFSRQSYALAISESEGGAVTDQAGRYYHGSRINLFARPAAGYVFVRWLGDGIVNPTTLSTAVEMTRDRNVSAQFASKSHKLEVLSEEGGTVSGNGSYDYGTQAPILAIPQSGYSFAGWSGSGILDSTDSNSTVRMIEDRQVTAKFELKTLDLIVEQSNGGTASGSGRFPFGTAAGIRADPERGYAFSHWTGGGIEDPASSSTTVIMSAFRQVKAHFSITKISSAKDSVSLGDDWYSHWLGSLFESDKGWCYHLGFGWIFPVFENDQESAWIWLPGHEWIWTDKTAVTDSFFWSSLDQAWRYYDFSMPNRKRFFRYLEESWVEE